MKATKILCEDPTIRFMLLSLLDNPKTAYWFKDIDDLVEDFNEGIRKQFPRMKFL